MTAENTPGHRLVLPARHRQVITRHAAATYPEECCGVLIGSVRPAAGGEPELALVERVLSIENERDDSRHNRFLITPETVLAAHREARSAGLDVVGYYHSHPDHPAVPSEYDREHAWPGMSYLIVAVGEGEPGDVRSWRLLEDRSRFEEEQVDAGHAPPETKHLVQEVSR